MKSKSIYRDSLQHCECPMCGTYTRISVWVEDMTDYQNGKLVQDCFPYLSIPERELIKSGYCFHCQEKIFGEVNLTDFGNDHIQTFEDLINSLDLIQNWKGELAVIQFIADFYKQKELSFFFSKHIINEKSERKFYEKFDELMSYIQKVDINQYREIIKYFE